MKATVAALLVLAACSSGGPDHSDAGVSTPPHVPESTLDEASGDGGLPTVDEMVRNTYIVAHDVCGHRPEAVFEDAGSRDVHQAAEWYSKGSIEGAHRAASYRGCADALLGREKDF